jgi:hypothetical protein
MALTDLWLLLLADKTWASTIGVRSDLALWCQSRMEEGGIVPPHSVLAPESALGSVRTGALSSAQVRNHCIVPQVWSSPS